MNGEYQGTSPWGKLFTFKVGYNGSIYSDASDSYTVQNPFCPGPGNCSPAADYRFTVRSYWAGVAVAKQPSQWFQHDVGADLPAKSRYMGTVSYIMMRQNENSFCHSHTAALPRCRPSSLNGEINTLLSNNVVTTQYHA